MKIKKNFNEKIKKNEAYHKAFECVHCGACASIWPKVQRCALSTRYKGSEANAQGLNSILMDIIEDKVSVSPELVDFIFRCTTCDQCVYNCAASLDPRVYIEALRKDLVLEGAVPKTIMQVFKDAAMHGNVWGQPDNQRSKWAEGLNIKAASESGDFEYLLFIGDSSSYVERNRETAKKFVDVLNRAGVTFAFLGNDEKSSGNEILRMGENGLFEMLAKENINRFKKYNIKKVVTLSPHSFHALKNEYPKLDPDLNIEVMHYTQLLTRLIKDGTLNFTKKVDKKVTYHDSCYLGRHNVIYEEPREILRAVPGLDLIEMDFVKEYGICCGGGGGGIWMERSDGVKVEGIRFKQALDMGVDVLATACPLCTQQFEAAREEAGNVQLEVKEIIELVQEAM
jgi:Fe-S oxidoreductase